MANINSKNTKAQIYAAYQELEQTKAKLEEQLKQAEMKAKQAAKQTSSVETKQSITPPEIISKTVTKPMEKINSNQYKITDIITNLEQLQIGFSSAVSQLSEQMITEATTLEELQEEIKTETEELEELHDLTEFEENTLPTLIDTYDESKKNFSEEFTKQKETLEQELEDLVKAWQKEQENKQRELKERNKNQEKTKQRDEKEYQYNLELQRQIDQEEYQQNIDQLYKDLEETRKQLEKQWEEREKTIADKEKEYAEAKQKVEEFEKELEAKIKKGKEEGKGIGYYQAKVKADLRSKEIEGETGNYQLKIQALESTILKNETRLTELSKQLDSSLKQVQDLAVKAIEGSSNRQSLDAMKEIALEQAKTQQKGK